MTITGELLKKVRSYFDRTPLYLSDDYESMFYELCFSICSPQTTFLANSRVNNELRRLNFYNKDIENLEEVCKPLRFYRSKAKMLLEAKIWSLINLRYPQALFCVGADLECMRWVRSRLMKEVRGLGPKTATQFIRNITLNKNLVIIDRHILNFLDIKRSVSSLKDYEFVEDLASKCAYNLGMYPAELDLLVFSNYSGTDIDEVR